MSIFLGRLFHYPVHQIGRYALISHQRFDLFTTILEYEFHLIKKIALMIAALPINGKIIFLPLSMFLSSHNLLNDMRSMFRV
jgi:hypothetical protein